MVPGAWPTEEMPHLEASILNRLCAGSGQGAIRKYEQKLLDYGNANTMAIHNDNNVAENQPRHPGTTAQACQAHSFPSMENGDEETFYTSSTTAAGQANLATRVIRSRR